MSRVGSGRVRRCSTCQVGSGQVGSGQEVFKCHGSGRVKEFSNIPGRVRSGHEVFKISQVGSGHDPRDTGHSRVWST